MQFDLEPWQLANTVPSRSEVDDMLEAVDRIQNRCIAKAQISLVTKRAQYEKIITAECRAWRRRQLDIERKEMELCAERYIQTIKENCDIIRFRVLNRFVSTEQIAEAFS